MRYIGPVGACREWQSDASIVATRASGGLARRFVEKQSREYRSKTMGKPVVLARSTNRNFADYSVGTFPKRWCWLLAAVAFLSTGRTWSILWGQTRSEGERLFVERVWPLL